MCGDACYYPSFVSTRPFFEGEERKGGPDTHCTCMDEIYGEFSNVIHQIPSLPRGTRPLLLPIQTCYVNLILHAALQLNDLLSALVDLPANKIVQFALALGVPKKVTTMAESNFPKDVDRVKIECLSWWLGNCDVSWEAIANALKTLLVDEKNLAEEILLEKCGISPSLYPS